MANLEASLWLQQMLVWSTRHFMGRLYFLFQCLSSRELLGALSGDVTHKSANNNITTLPGWLFERVCPALVYQLAAVSASERGGCVHVSEDYEPSELGNYETEETSRNMFQGTCPNSLANAITGFIQLYRTFYFCLQYGCIPPWAYW